MTWKANEPQQTFGAVDALSYQCQDSNIDHHGYCDGTADDGERCECAYCRHPRLKRSRTSVVRKPVHLPGDIIAVDLQDGS